METADIKSVIENLMEQYKLDDAVTRTYTIEPVWKVVVEFIQ